MYEYTKSRWVIRLWKCAFYGMWMTPQWRTTSVEVTQTEGEVNSGSGSRGSRCKAQASTSLEATDCSKRKSPQGGRAGQRARDLPKQWTPLWKQAGARDSTPTCTCPPRKAHFNPVNAPLETASLSSPLTHGSVPASPRVPGMPGWGAFLFPGHRYKGPFSTTLLPGPSIKERFKAVCFPMPAFLLTCEEPRGQTQGFSFGTEKTELWRHKDMGWREPQRLS